MGCSETKNAASALPLLTMIFEPGNETQKNYCVKFYQSFHHSKSIRYEIKSFANSTFSIVFKLNEQMHTIQSVFDENEMQNGLNKIYALLEGVDANVYINPPENNPVPGDNNNAPGENPNPIENNEQNQNNNPQNIQ